MSTQKLQLVQNVVLRAVLGASCIFVCATLIVYELPWLIVYFQEQSEVLIITFKVFDGMEPGYLKD